MVQKTILWDFDGTLVRFTSWRGALMDVLNEMEPGHGINEELIRPYLKDCFPWHRPEESHTHLATAELWWAHLEPVFMRAFGGVGFSEKRARELAHHVRRHMTGSKRFVLFQDTVPTLREVRARGWRQGILSNHMPELPGVAEALGLAPFMDFCLTSGITGYEKPNPKAFELALAKATNLREVWMVGDNLVSDVKGAEAAGMRAILVRQPPVEGVRYCAANLPEAVMIIDRSF